MPDRVNRQFFIDIRTGSLPSDLKEEDNGSLLGMAVLEFDQLAAGQIVASGDAGYFRIRNAVGIVVAQGRVVDDRQVVEDDFALTIDNTTFVADGTFVDPI